MGVSDQAVADSVRPASRSRSLRAALVRGSAFEMVGYGLSQLIRFGSNLVLSRMLMPEAFGLAALVNILNQGLIMLSDVGLPTVVVQSERGEVAPEGKEVELIDAVRVARTDAKGRPTVITSSRMTVFPDKEYAQTQQAVRIEAANGVTTAQGMKAYMNDGRILLLSNVRGQHEAR